MTAPKALPSDEERAESVAGPHETPCHLNILHRDQTCNCGRAERVAATIALLAQVRAEASQEKDAEIRALQERVVGFIEGERLWAEEFDEDDDLDAANLRVARTKCDALREENARLRPGIKLAIRELEHSLIKTPQSRENTREAIQMLEALLAPAPEKAPAPEPAGEPEADPHGHTSRLAARTLKAEARVERLEKVMRLAVAAMREQARAPQGSRVGRGGTMKKPLRYQTISETLRRCASCHKRLPRGSKAIELGIDATGTMYLCSSRCCDAYNRGWR